MDIQIATYILENFSDLIADNENTALRYQYFIREEIEKYKIEVAEKLLLEKTEEIIFNYCPRCGKLARIALAKQCRYCRFDWH